MITKAQRKTLKNSIGFGHIKKIADYLKNKGILRPDKQPYSESQISNVFNGVSHTVLEEAIIDCALIYKEKKAAKKAARKEKINSLKAV